MACFSASGMCCLRSAKEFLSVADLNSSLKRKGLALPLRWQMLSPVLGWTLLIPLGVEQVPLFLPVEDGAFCQLLPSHHHPLTVPRAVEPVLL